MKYIITGCPYGSLSDLNESIDKICGSSIRLVLVEDILSLHASYIVVRGEEDNVNYSSIICSFIRYPYDLIPPHSGSFELRENIEFFKTVGLILDSVSINKLASTWMLRNRCFSLGEAARFGAKIADYCLIKTSIFKFNYDRYAVKALGNCFVSDSIQADFKDSKFFSTEEDDGDIATILPASLMSFEEVGSYIKIAKTAFLQAPINDAREYRAYIVGKESVFYERAPYCRFDKSFAEFEKTETQFPSNLKKSLDRLMSTYSLGYLCVDVIIDSNDQVWLIDLNPYGSLPRSEKLPEITDSLAKLIVTRAKNGY